MKSYLIPILILFTVSLNLNAQVGINTSEPRTEVGLDVNGVTNITTRIALKGTSTNTTQTGSTGNNNEIIVSAGEIDPTVWERKTIPNGFGASYSLSSMNTYFDNTGVDLLSNGTVGYNETSTLNDAYTSTGTAFATCTAGNCWRVIPGLSNSFTVYKANNKVNFIFQTTAQINSAANASFACGIFINTPGNTSNSAFTLRGVRTDVVPLSSAGNYKMFNLNLTLENLPIPGGAGGTVYQARVACRGRNVATNNLGIGKVVNATQLNSAMSQSSLNISVLESWQ